MTLLRFAVVCEEGTLERWHLDCLDRLEQVAERAALIITPRSATPPPSPAASAAMRRYARRIEAQRRTTPADRFAEGPRIHAGVDAPVDIPELDFVLKLGRGPVPTGLADARHGIWYFEHETGEDLLPFFHEVYESADVTRAALLALRPGIGAPAILDEGWFPTQKHSYVANHELVVGAAAAWPARVCERALSGAEINSGETGRRLSPGRARRASLLRFRTAIARRRIALAWRRLFRHPQWNIGVLDTPVASIVDGGYDDSRVDWFPLGHRRSFLADPFGVVRDRTLHVVCESFDYRDAKGHIASLAYSDGEFSPEERALSLDVHMSYPLLLESSGEVLCVPETADANEIALFRAEEFPRQWSKLAVLVPDFAGVDPTIFRHGGRWWLLCTKQGGYEDVELWIWHAPALLGPWVEHARNPVKSDVRSARPAGVPFLHGNELYRPAQDCSRTYGGRIALQRITRLTPTDFAEKPVTVLEASAGSPFPSGPHTLTVLDDLILLDSRRTVFVWHAFRAFLGIWARDVAGRLPMGRRSRRRAPA